MLVTDAEGIDDLMYYTSLQLNATGFDFDGVELSLKESTMNIALMWLFEARSYLGYSYDNTWYHEEEIDVWEYEDADPEVRIQYNTIRYRILVQDIAIVVQHKSIFRLGK